MIFFVPFFRRVIMLVFRAQLIPFVVVFAFLFLQYIYDNDYQIYYFVNNLLRGRFDIWMFHINQYYDAGVVSNLIGFGFVKSAFFVSDGTFYGYPDEFHSGYGRLIKTYGIFGFLLAFFAFYCFYIKLIKIFFSRRFDVSVILSSYFALALYSISNEPLHYPGIILFFMLPIVVENYFRVYTVPRMSPVSGMLRHYRILRLFAKNET